MLAPYGRERTEQIGAHLSEAYVMILGNKHKKYGMHPHVLVCEILDSCGVRLHLRSRVPRAAVGARAEGACARGHPGAWMAP